MLHEAKLIKSFHQILIFSENLPIFILDIKNHLHKILSKQFTIPTVIVVFVCNCKSIKN
jgi:hypothetical protein